MVSDQISESHLFQKKKNGFIITWIEIVIRHSRTEIIGRRKEVWFLLQEEKNGAS